MHPTQLALVRRAADALAAECLRSPTATWSAGHLRVAVVDELLRAGAAVLERGAGSAEEKLVRLVGDDVLRVERHELDPRHRFRGGRGRRVADVRLLDPVLLALDVHARSSAAGFDRAGSRALRERLAALADGSSDALLIACDRRAYDALRIVRAHDDADAPALARLCASLLPASSTLTLGRAEAEARVAGRTFRAAATITPMVFGTQRVIAALWPAQRASTPELDATQLDAFEVA